MGWWTARAFGLREESVARDRSLEARALTQRGLEDYARGRLREAVLAWEKATQLAPQDPRARSLLEFARMRIGERDARPVAHSHGATMESPIPGFLASLTAVNAGEPTGSSFPKPPADGEWAQINTRRVLAGSDEGPEPGKDAQGPADTWKDLPIQVDNLQASARGLLEECRSALSQGRVDRAALAAEMALQLSEQARSPEVDGIVDSTRPLFERAFCACIGDMKSAPICASPSEALDQHGLDSRAASLMSRMDGMLSVGDLLDGAGMPRFDALRLMAALRRAQAVDMVPLG
jgi:tetratricopeptide (TPR) repeat protein